MWLCVSCRRYFIKSIQGAKESVYKTYLQNFTKFTNEDIEVHTTTVPQYYLLSNKVLHNILTTYLLLVMKPYAVENIIRGDISQCGFAFN